MSYLGIFKTKTGIEKEIDDFLDHVSESGLLFTQGVKAYLRGNIDSFVRLLEQIVDNERNADILRRSIEELLYRRTLIPESRGDVPRMIENMDSLLGMIDGAFMIFQPILVHIILAHPDQNGIWWYPIFPWTQAILIIYFCRIAWKNW